MRQAVAALEYSGFCSVARSLELALPYLDEFDLRVYLLCAFIGNDSHKAAVKSQKFAPERRSQQPF